MACRRHRRRPIAVLSPLQQQRRRHQCQLSRIHCQRWWYGGRHIAAEIKRFSMISPDTHFSSYCGFTAVASSFADLPDVYRKISTIDISLPPAKRTLICFAIRFADTPILLLITEMRGSFYVFLPAYDIWCWVFDDEARLRLWRRPTPLIKFLSIAMAQISFSSRFPKRWMLYW